MDSVPTSSRRELFRKLQALVEQAWKVHYVKRILVAGSFVTAKLEPNDLDMLILLDPSYVGVKLRPFEYNVVEARVARRLFKADVFTAVEGSVAAGNLLKHFQRNRDLVPVGIVEIQR